MRRRSEIGTVELCAIETSSLAMRYSPVEERWVFYFEVGEHLASLDVSPTEERGRHTILLSPAAYILEDVPEFFKSHSLYIKEEARHFFKSYGLKTFPREGMGEEGAKGGKIIIFPSPKTYNIQRRRSTDFFKLHGLWKGEGLHIYIHRRIELNISPVPQPINRDG